MSLLDKINSALEYNKLCSRDGHLNCTLFGIFSGCRYHGCVYYRCCATRSSLLPQHNEWHCLF